MASLPDTAAVVVGASRGIGLEIARVLSGAGARVAVVARGEKALRRAAEAVNALAIPADVTNADDVRRLAAEVGAWLDGAGPDVVVNSAGAFELAPLAETDPAMFDRQIAGNLRAPFLVIRAFLPGMLERGSGHVVSIGSIAGRQAFASNGAYSAAKFGLRGLHQVLDVELRGTGVRATLVEPAATNTTLWDAIDAERNPGLPPRNAMLPPAAVADAVLYALAQPAGIDVPSISIQRS